MIIKDHKNGRVMDVTTVYMPIKLHTNLFEMKWIGPDSGGTIEVSRLELVNMLTQMERAELEMLSKVPASIEEEYLYNAKQDPKAEEADASSSTQSRIREEEWRASFSRERVQPSGQGEGQEEPIR